MIKAFIRLLPSSLSLRAVEVKQRLGLRNRIFSISVDKVVITRKTALSETGVVDDKR